METFYFVTKIVNFLQVGVVVILVQVELFYYLSPVLRYSKFALDPWIFLFYPFITIASSLSDYTRDFAISQTIFS